MMLFRAALGMGCVASLSALTLAEPTTLQLLDRVPGTNGTLMQVFAISGDGTTAAGYSGDRAATWNRDGTSRFLTVDGQYSSHAFAVDHDATHVVGGAYIGTGGIRHAYCWTNGAPEILRTLVPTGGEAWAVSQDGSIAAGALGNIAVRWSPAVGGGSAQSIHVAGMLYSRARGMNSSGSVVVGTTQSDSQLLAFKWTAQTGSRVLPGGGPYESGAIAVSADGSIVVGISQNRIARWIGDSPPEILTSQRFEEGVGRGCSADGSVIVGTGRGNGGSEAVFWTDGTGLRSVWDLAFERGLPVGRYWFSEAADVSDDGRTIIGVLWESGVDHCYILHIGDCPADFDGDLRVDFFDYLDYVQAFAVGDAAADRDGDGTVDLFDYLDFVEALAVGCE